MHTITKFLRVFYTYGFLLAFVSIDGLWAQMIAPPPPPAGGSEMYIGLFLSFILVYILMCAPKLLKGLDLGRIAKLNK